MMIRRAAALALALVAGPSLAPAAPALKIGVSVPLSGPDAVYGNQIKLGVDQAIIDLGNGFAGAKAAATVRDDGGDPKKGVDVAKALLAAKIGIVVGPFSSAVTVPASAVYAEAHALDITPSAMAPLVTDRGLATVFRTCGREDEQAEVAARFLLARHIGRVAVVHDRTTIGKQLADEVRKLLAKGGVRDAFYGSFDKGNRDLAGLAARIKAANPQVVFFGGAAADAGQLSKLLRDINARATLMGGVAMAGDDFASLAGPAAEGALMVFPQDPRSRPAAADLLHRFQARGIEPEAYVFYAYAAVQVVAQAASAAGTVEPDKLAATMHDGRTFPTVLGDLAFDAKGDPKVSDFTIYVWHKGASGRMTFDEQARS